MFEDSLLESADRFHTKRGATTALSLALQLMVVSALVLLPLIYTEALPRMQMLLPPIAPPPPAAPPRGEPAPHRPAGPVLSEFQQGALVFSRSFPPHASRIEDPAPPETSGCGDSCFAVPGGTGPDLAKNSLLSAILSRPTPIPSQPRVDRLIVSRGVTEGHLVRRVEPEYPPLARQGHIEGDVVLRAVIGRDGSIEDLTLVSGHPLLARAALEAVRHWRYQPFLLNGREIEVDTQVQVRFRLSRN